MTPGRRCLCPRLPRAVSVNCPTLRSEMTSTTHSPRQSWTHGRDAPRRRVERAREDGQHHRSRRMHQPRPRELHPKHPASRSSGEPIRQLRPTNNRRRPKLVNLPRVRSSRGWLRGWLRGRERCCARCAAARVLGGLEPSPSGRGCSRDRDGIRAHVRVPPPRC